MFSFMNDIVGPLFGVKVLNFEEFSYQKLIDDGSMAYTLKMNIDGNVTREEGQYFSSCSNTPKDLEPGS